MYSELINSEDLNREEKEMIESLKEISCRLTGKTHEQLSSADHFLEETKRDTSDRYKPVPNCEECAFSSYKKENGIQICYCSLSLFDTVHKIVGKGEKLTCKSFILDRLEGCRQICMDGFEADFDD